MRRSLPRLPKRHNPRSSPPFTVEPTPSHSRPRMISSGEKKFSGALHDELQALHHAGETRTFPAGKTIFSAGDPGDGFYLIDKGQVQISALVGPTESRVLATIGPGDFFGEMA